MRHSNAPAINKIVQLTRRKCSYIPNNLCTWTLTRLRWKLAVCQFSATKTPNCNVKASLRVYVRICSRRLILSYLLRNWNLFWWKAVSCDNIGYDHVKVFLFCFRCVVFILVRQLNSHLKHETGWSRGNVIRDACSTYVSLKKYEEYCEMLDHASYLRWIVI